MIRQVRVLCSLLGIAVGLPAWSAAQAPNPSTASRRTLVEAVEHLPEFLPPDSRRAFVDRIESATVPERDEAIPKLMPWVEDERPEMRRLALLTIYLLYLPSASRAGQGFRVSLPARYVPAVTAHLRDPDREVRKAAATALLPTEYSGEGKDDMVKLVVPMLRDPDILTEYPDPFFVEADRQMLARMTPAQRTAFASHPRKVITLPAQGVELLALLTGPTLHPTNTVDDAIIAFLDREDQTKSTLGACLHTLELGRGSERVNDEALRRAFEKKAITIFLLQFITRLRLNGDQRDAWKARLLELSNDPSAHPAPRRSAAAVAACWKERDASCRPSEQDLSEQLDTR